VVAGAVVTFGVFANALTDIGTLIDVAADAVVVLEASIAWAFKVAVDICARFVVFAWTDNGAVYIFVVRTLVNIFAR
jgi:hypothetical protein